MNNNIYIYIKIVLKSMLKLNLNSHFKVILSFLIFMTLYFYKLTCEVVTGIYNFILS